MTPEQVRKIIDDFMDETGAELCWRITCSKYGSGRMATEDLCQRIAAASVAPDQPAVVEAK